MPYGLVDEASEANGKSEEAAEVPEAAAEAAAEVAEAAAVAAAVAEAGFTLASGLEGAAADSAIMVSFSFLKSNWANNVQLGPAYSNKNFSQPPRHPGGGIDQHHR